MSVKRLHSKKFAKNYEALQELWKGISQKEVAVWGGAPKTTLSTWNKNRAKIF